MAKQDEPRNRQNSSNRNVKLSDAKFVDVIPEGYTPTTVDGETIYVKESETPGTVTPDRVISSRTKSKVKPGKISKIPRTPRPTSTPPNTKIDALRLKKSEPKGGIYGGADTYASVSQEQPLKAYGFTRYEYPSESGNVTGQKRNTYFDEQGREITYDLSDPTKNFIDGKFVPQYTGRTRADVDKEWGIQQYSLPTSSGVNKANPDFKGSILMPGMPVTKQAGGGAGEINIINKGVAKDALNKAEKEFTPTQYDASGNPILDKDKPLPPITPEKFAKGGIVGKMKKKYAQGGEIVAYNYEGKPVDQYGNIVKISGMTDEDIAKQGLGIIQNQLGGVNPSQNKSQGSSTPVGGNTPVQSGVQEGKLGSKVVQGLGGKEAAIGLATNVGAAGLGLGATVIDERNKDAQGRYTKVGEATASNAMKGAAMGAKLGQVAGPTGTLIGAGVGAVGGGIYGYTKGKKDVKAIKESEVKRKEELNKANLESRQEQALRNRSLGDVNPVTNNPYNEKNVFYDENDNIITPYAKGGLVQKFAKGGEIKGKGGPTDDKIDAKVEEGSFVVPAKNADLAKGIRKLYLKAKEGKADLKQPEGEEVKLSNGEHLFTPEENEYLESIGINLEDLAPEAENGEDEMAKGGLTAKKAKMILHDKKVHGKPLTEQQRKFFGAIASGQSIKMACGGEVKKYAKGGMIEDTLEDTVDPKKERAAIAAEEAAIAAKKSEEENVKSKEKASKNIEEHRKRLAKIVSSNVDEIKKLESEYEKVKKGQDPNYLNPEYKRDRMKELLDKIDAQKESLNKSTKEYNLSKDASNYNELGEFSPKSDNVKKESAATDLKTGLKTPPISKEKTYQQWMTPPAGYKGTMEDWKKVVDNNIASGKIKVKGAGPNIAITTGVTKGKSSGVAGKVASTYTLPSTEPQPGDEVVVPKSDAEVADAMAKEAKSAEAASMLNKSALDADTEPQGQSKAKQRDGSASILGNVDPTSLIGLGQAYLGAKMLKGQQRPGWSPELDPIYQGMADRATKEAQYGLRPEEKFLAEQDIQNALNDAKTAGVSYSGGSATQAYNLNRSAINDAWRAKLGLRAEDERLRMEKQQRADELGAMKAQLIATNKRQAFNDAMSAFQQKQAAGSELLSAGLANTIWAYRFNQDLRARQAANKARTSWSDNWQSNNQ